MLLYTKYNEPKNFRKAYYNLEILKKEPNYFPILAYEARRFFGSNAEWVTAFESIIEKEPRDLLDVLELLVDIISEKCDKIIIKNYKQYKRKD